ncbi:MAG TPA: hypothetical protein O0Y06_00210 [Methanocorpusculum sp.]|nr:hypothetical protein [Methanocorpusculum sp.]HJK79310.1 hypothetical protein [Methanocorpusculum sp.]
MPNDTPVDTLIAAAEASLDAASNALLHGDTDAAADYLEVAVSGLLRAGSSLLTSVHTTDIAALESSIARILRALAERFGILPEDHQPVLALLPESVDILDTSTKTAAEMHLPVSGVCDVVRSVYESEEAAIPELSEEETDACISAGRLLLDLLSGQRTLTDAVFARDGAYDAFSDLAAPYLISGAVFLGGGESTGSCEEKIPEMLAGPIRRLVELLAALLTSAFMSGLILLIIRRVLAVRRVRPGMVDNVIFAGSMASLIAANLPMFVDGARQVAAELRSLQEIIDRADGGVEIPVV